MQAETLNCPMCGAPAASDASRCEHCGARLATVACPSCFGLMFAGAKYCSHCGAQADRTELPGASKQACPRCRVELELVKIGNSTVRECRQCQGIWADREAVKQICADREKQAAVLGMPVTVATPGNGSLEVVKYVPCPVCGNLMNRVNFARCSHVVVDVCMRHGTWFDKDELRRIVEFIRAGGLEKAREQEMAQLEQQRREMRAQQLAGAWDGHEPRSREGEWDKGLSLAAEILAKLWG